MRPAALPQALAVQKMQPVLSTACITLVHTNARIPKHHACTHHGLAVADASQYGAPQAVGLQVDGGQRVDVVGILPVGWLVQLVGWGSGSVEAGG